ncbi:endonuclease/exonuclease/phosphatase family protein [Chishuiella sp.]|uniref:endonuclease/exonuclease/phosphatase family protein n=1 Tax=Chishuiella sp. TaxID=1969467 RepID=UPI0028AE01F4|nr:endonuclease/exonuclease/phosphatase family protein [Chishuiella sp.]
MKIITWNCNGAFRNKYPILSEFNADILVVQECENPIVSNDNNYKNFAKNYFWIGNNKNKGLGIFAKDNILLEKLNYSNIYLNHEVNYFLPVLVNKTQVLIGIWAHKNNSPTFGYIGQIWKYFQLNSDKIKESIIIGDFNSNKIWDCWDRWWNHSDVINSFEKSDLRSIYHELKNEAQGEESIKTFFLHKDLHKGYHIDYCFIPYNLLNKKTNLIIPEFNKFSSFSDHLPLIIEL